MADFELDYEKMFKTLQKQVNILIAEQNEYFEKISYINERKSISDMVMKNLTKMKLHDQLKIIRLSAKLAAECASLCEKYGLEEDDFDE